MVEHYTGTVITSGYLMVLRFGALYAKYAPRYQGLRHRYAMPRSDRPWSGSTVKYRGTDRDALDANVGALATSTELLLADLEKVGRCVDGLLFNQEDLGSAVASLGDEADQYEVIWVRENGTQDTPPDGFAPLGFEPSYFVGDHFSASCDCMLIPRWHGPDEDGTAFIEHFRRLNQHGLFESRRDAVDFLDYYVSFDWTENNRSDYVIVEVFALPGHGTLGAR